MRSTFSVATPSNLVDKVNEAARADAHVIISTDDTAAQTVFNLALSYPNIKFIAFSADGNMGSSPNTLVIRPRWYRSLYLAGIVCAIATKNSKVGIILPKPTSVVLSQYANAFYVGANAINPSLKIGMVTVDVWNTSIAATAAAGSLLEWGAGCMTAVQGNAVANQIFAEKKLPSVGFASNARIFSGDYVWTSFLVDPAPTFETLMKMVVSGEWNGPAALMTSVNVERGDWSIRVDRPTRSRIDQFVDINNNDPLSRLFCREQYEILGLPWPPNVTERCPPLEYSFDPKTMRPTRHLILVAEWTTETATIPVYWKWAEPIAIISNIISALLILFCIYLIPHIIYYRKSRVYATASWLVLLIIPISSIITLGSTVPYLDKPTVLKCNLRMWIEALGVITLLGALLARNYKHFMWKRNGLTLLSKEYEERFTVSAYELFVMWLLPLHLGQLSLLVFATSLTPIYPSFSSAPYLPTGKVQSECKMHTATLFYVMTAYQAIAALANLTFFYVLKNIPLLGADVVASGATVLNLAFFAGLNAFVTTVVARANITIVLALALKIIVCAVALAVLVVPKWWAVQIRGVKEELDLIEPSNNADSSAASINGSAYAASTQSNGISHAHGRKLKEQIPEFYSESSESSSSSSFAEDYDYEDKEPSATTSDTNESHKGELRHDQKSKRVSSRLSRGIHSENQSINDIGAAHTSSGLDNTAGEVENSDEQNDEITSSESPSSEEKAEESISSPDSSAPRGGLRGFRSLMASRRPLQSGDPSAESDSFAPSDEDDSEVNERDSRV